IWEIVLHITAWVDAARRRVEGEEAKLSAEQDWPPVRETTERAWEAALEGLKTAHQAMQETVLRLEDSRLKDRVPGQQYSVYFLLHGVVQHGLYHAGQIALLKKVAS
ncbi:MAG: DinB family protein, partial [Acidobacteria bacterium]|nr:DinB family protein [Acidobacteriota bacterium]